MPCAFAFKNNVVSRNPDEPFLKIKGECRDSIQCRNIFIGLIEEKPIIGSDVRLKVSCNDTRNCSHEVMKRQLKNEKRQLIGQQVVKEGSANLRRKIAFNK